MPREVSPIHDMGEEYNGGFFLKKSKTPNGRRSITIVHNGGIKIDDGTQHSAGTGIFSGKAKKLTVSPHTREPELSPGVNILFEKTFEAQNTRHIVTETLLDNQPVTFDLSDELTHFTLDEKGELEEEVRKFLKNESVGMEFSEKTVSELLRP